MNILLVEDDEPTVATLTEMLALDGHTVRATGEVLVAFEILRRGRIDLILMDIGLPGMNGLTFARKLRTYEAFRSIPLVAVSGGLRMTEGQRAIAAGCDAYLEKPIQYQELQAVLHAVARG